ncbi:DUF3782 domain-containing protein [candidate division KSB3 bacterium]|uniref:DUF3782 domain-containing protein n=1 Tax=candidate division KSB3 bacterium TaxID=2044937 RepID=A0A9D5JTD4_9BACT|nr:DUF3782 domain-containing protein [candidate division KSB3 bacterium]MBD3323858.1 DUF3782 domain-containing protein [candidate division KSB3 bacterium]
MTREHYADKGQTEHRIERMLDELKLLREQQEEWWQEQAQLWRKQDERWEQQEERWREQTKLWQQQEERWQEWEQKQEAERQEEAARWRANQQVIEDMLASIKRSERRYDSTIGALGARWGLHSEAAFRNGLKAILEESFDVNVERYEDFDYTGQVFGRPDQIELDVILYNGTIILCELKSSISKSQLYAFWRKCQFYEDKHQRTVNRRIVISPMVEESAKKVAEELGIEVYGYADDVPLSL